MLASLPLPVAVVSAASGTERSCSTATVSYVSFDPPLLSTALNATGRTRRLLELSGEFSVSVLADDQAELAVRAARPAEHDKFAEQDLPVADPPPGHAAPAIAGAAAVFWCTVESAAPVHQSLVVVGRVVHHAEAPGGPLLRFRRRYHVLGAPVPVAEEAPYPL